MVQRHWTNFRKDEEIVDANDILNTQLQWMIKSLLMLPDYQQRQQALAQLQSWLNKTTLSSKGVAGGFKSDGSIFIIHNIILLKTHLEV